MMRGPTTIVAVLVAVATGSVEARTYHVDPAGDDANDGSSGAPLQTIQAAADRVAPGDEVIVRAGVYESSPSGFLIELDRGGTAQDWVTFRSETPGAAIIDGGDHRSSHCWVLLDGASYVRIEGFEVPGCRHAGFHSNDGAQHISFIGNHVHHVGRRGTDTTAAGSASGLVVVIIVMLIAVAPRRRRASALAIAVSLAVGCDAPGQAASDQPDAMPDASPQSDASVEPALVPALDVSVWTRTLTDPDIDCFWELDYRHLIIGTQHLEVTRQQLAIALRGGMTVDLYVYLDWAFDLTAQVMEAVALRTEFPQIGRIWLDVEEDPAGRSPAALRALIDESIAALGDAPGGIYTGKGWWQSYLENTVAYAEQPLWYARYDDHASLDAWDDPSANERFGGWQAPAGKQYADYHVHTCDLAVDRNVMWIATAPNIVVDRSIPADDGTPPDAPTNLHPSNNLVVTTEYVRPTAPALREATSYEIALESWNGSAFVPYWTTTRPVSDLLVFPTLRDRDYRWRMRAANQHGFGAWSEWAVFALR